MAAGGLALIKAVVLGVGCLIALSTSALPAWFKFKVPVSLDGGRTVEERTLSVGLFFMDRGEIFQTDLTFVDKASNAQTLPGLFKVGQIFYAAGSMGCLVCFCASLIYCCRKYNTSTGEMCLAGAVFPSAVSMLLGLVFAMLSTVGSPGQVWETFPVPNHYVQLEAVPKIELDIVFYVAAGAVLICLIASALFWMHACMLCKQVERVRYQMLHAPLTDDERGVSEPGKVFRFPNTNTGFRYDGFRKPQGGEVDF